MITESAENEPEGNANNCTFKTPRHPEKQTATIPTREIVAFE